MTTFALIVSIMVGATSHDFAVDTGLTFEDCLSADALSIVHTVEHDGRSYALTAATPYRCEEEPRPLKITITPRR